MNARGSFYSVVWLINLKIITINTMRINHLRSVPRDSITEWEIKNIIHIHYPIATDHWLGCSRVPWLYYPGPPSWRLQVDWIYNGLAGGVWVPWVEGGRSLLHMILHEPGWAEIHSTPASFVRHIKHNCTLVRSDMTAVHPIPPLLGTVTPLIT